MSAVETTEVLTAYVALVGFFSCVDPLVGLKPRTLTEALQSSHLNSFSRCGRSGGLEKIGGETEGLPTHSHLWGFSPVWTLWWWRRFGERPKPSPPPHTCELFASVAPLVVNKLGTVSEALPTHIAFVGLLPGVDPLMGLKTRGLAEALRRHTLVGFLACVDPLMDAEVYGLTEALVTRLTFVRRLLS